MARLLGIGRYCKALGQLIQSANMSCLVMCSAVTQMQVNNVYRNLASKDTCGPEGLLQKASSFRVCILIKYTVIVPAECHAQTICKLCSRPKVPGAELNITMVTHSMFLQQRSSQESFCLVLEMGLPSCAFHGTHCMSIILTAACGSCRAIVTAVFLCKGILQKKVLFS